MRRRAAEDYPPFVVRRRDVARRGTAAVWDRFGDFLWRGEIAVEVPEEAARAVRPGVARERVFVSVEPERERGDVREVEESRLEAPSAFDDFASRRAGVGVLTFAVEVREGDGDRWPTRGFFGRAESF